MITDSFNIESEEIIKPEKIKNAMKVDAVIVTFSFIIERYVLENYDAAKVAELKFVNELLPVYKISRNGRTYGFFRTYVGGSSAGGSVEDVMRVLDTDKVIVFGSAGCLDREITHGKIMVPSSAYRDEGMSYHYAKPADYIVVKNCDKVADFMRENGVPYAIGKTWTTDAFYRETRENFTKRKADGCISVEMECASLQAIADFRGFDFYTFFMGEDLLDAPKWDRRKAPDGMEGPQHDGRYFDIAIALADYLTK